MADPLFAMIGARARTTGGQRQFRVVPTDICTGHAIPQLSQHRPGFTLETNLPGVFCAAKCDTVPSNEFQAEEASQFS
jgi:hypothetical protein